MLCQNFVLIFVVSVVTDVHLADAKRQERKCRVVPPTATSCIGSTPATSCKNSTALEAVLASGSSQANVCSKYSTTPVPIDILVTFKLPAVKCKTYLGLTSICFVPDLASAKSCTELASDAALVRTSCTDQTALRARFLANPSSLRLCLLNATAPSDSVTYVENNVKMFLKLAETEGEDSDEF